MDGEIGGRGTGHDVERGADGDLIAEVYRAEGSCPVLGRTGVLSL